MDANHQAAPGYRPQRTDDRHARLNVDPVHILSRHYRMDSPLGRTLLRHSKQVRDKALAAAQKVAYLNPDRQFIAQAAMLHDIGICQTAAAKLGCTGPAPYIRHGIIGRKILEAYGLTAHALVCERHVGVGISRQDIRKQNLPLPQRDMLPITLEEIIICYADKFFSKSNGGTAHSLAAVISELQPFGPDKVERFMQWHRLLEG